jgi:hypothetical protein
VFIWIKLTVKFDYFIYLEAKEKGVRPTFPFLILPVLPTQTQEWGSMKYFILEKGFTYEKV